MFYGYEKFVAKGGMNKMTRTKLALNCWACAKGVRENVDSYYVLDLLNTDLVSTR